MKSAYFWIQLPSNVQHNSKRNRCSSVTAELIELETIQPDLAERFRHAIEFVLINAKQFFRDKLNQPPKLKIRSYSDNQGNTWWYVYDPITKTTEHLHSEAEVKAWLKQHYYHEETRFFN